MSPNPNSHFLAIFFLISGLGRADDQKSQNPEALDLDLGIFSSLNPETGEKSPWSLRALAGFGTSSRLDVALTGRYERIPDTLIYSLETSYLLKENWLDLPLDISLSGAGMLHTSEFAPTSNFQANAYLKVEWTNFWWDDHLRTRFGVGEGLSFQDRTSYSETVRRSGRKSKRLLNYLDFSLSLNLADLGEISQLNHLFISDLAFLDDTWFVINVSHRSGIYGAFGKYSDTVEFDGKRRNLDGGENLVMFGISHRF